MVDFVPNERATPIRMPSTANLMLDSADRGIDVDSAFEFQITKNYSILNGFFTRIATTEVVLEWCEPNIGGLTSGLNEGFGNNTIVFDLSGSGANTYVGSQIITLGSGHYTAAQALDAIVYELNDLSGTTGMTFAIDSSTGQVYLRATGGEFFWDDSGNIGDRPLGFILGLGLGGAPHRLDYKIDCPDLRPYRYIDFVSSQLTYNQDLKDSSTAPIVRDVLCRWYFAFDEQNQLDKYGFPILMGYTSFCLRRLFNPPKQIKWSSNQPVGNLAFQVYDNYGNLIVAQAIETDWLMTLQVSEV